MAFGGVVSGGTGRYIPSGESQRLAVFSPVAELRSP